MASYNNLGAAATAAMACAALETNMHLEKQEIVHRSECVRRYVQTWSEADEAKRLGLLRSCYEESASYSDPAVCLDGLHRLNTYLGELQQSYPGCHIVQQSVLDTYSSFGRFTWLWALADGTVRRRGVDFVRFSPGNRLQTVIGFFDPL